MLQKYKKKYLGCTKFWHESLWCSIKDRPKNIQHCHSHYHANHLILL